MTGRSPFRLLTCDEAAELLPELALGILPGDQRTAALAHVADCGACQAELDELADTADAVVDLVPRVEPPAGFEQRVLAAVTDSAAPAPAPTPIRPRRVTGPRAWLGAAAAVALVAAGFGGWSVGHGSPARPHGVPAAAPGPLVEASLMSGTTTVGRVFAYWDSPGWVYMTVEGAGITGRVACVLTTADGNRIDLGWFDVTGGRGSWGAPVPVDPSTIRQARLVTEGGRVLATARL